MPHKHVIRQRTYVDMNQSEVVLFDKLAMSHFKLVTQATAIHRPNPRINRWWRGCTCGRLLVSSQAFHVQVSSRFRTLVSYLVIMSVKVEAKFGIFSWRMAEATSWSNPVLQSDSDRAWRV